jgi:integrase
VSTRGSAGEASIFKGNDGRWHGWITVGVRTNGERDRRHRSGRTRAEVVRKIRELEIKRETGGVGAVCATLRAGPSLSPWACANPKRSLCSGKTSI